MLRHWAHSPGSVPFDPAAPSARNAFLHGALAPDMGLFPRADPLVSQHVHRGGASDVGRLLLGAARDENARAFAWGWISHIVADVRIHPLINDGAAVLLMEADAAPDAANRLVAHIRVELGVEGWYAARRVEPRGVPLTHHFDEAGITELAAPLRAVYGLRLADEAVLALHRNVTPFAALCDRLAAMLAADLAADGRPPARADFLRMPAARWLASAALPRTSPVFAFLNPVRPEPWLIERVDVEIDAFVTRMDALLHGEIEGLPNYDLNDGRVVADTFAAARVA